MSRPRPRPVHAALPLCLLSAACLSACRDDPPAPESTPGAIATSIETLAASLPAEDSLRTVLPITTGSGETARLVYTTIRLPSDSASPGAAPEDTVTVRFAAGLDRGPQGVTIYDSTDQRNRDFSFSLADPGVIRGLREAIPGMRPGEIRRIEIPWRLAYGENGRGEIPPATDLVFAVELVSID